MSHIESNPCGAADSLELAIAVAQSKYLQHVPLERQARRLKRQGSMLWQALDQLAGVLRPAYDALREHVTGGDSAHVGQSVWRVLGKASGARRVRSIDCADAIYYQVDATLSELLDGFSGLAIFDEYADYAAAPGLLPDARVVWGWDGVQRALLGTLDLEQIEHQRAKQWISELFEIERDLPSWHAMRDDQLQTHALSYVEAIRKERCRPLCDALHAWALRTYRGTDARLDRALAEATAHWRELTCFLDDPRTPFCKQAPRAEVADDPQHYAAKSLRGTEVAAIFYSLIESAARAGRDPSHYLRTAAQAAMRDGSGLLPRSHGLEAISTEALQQMMDEADTGMPSDEPDITSTLIGRLSGSSLPPDFCPR